MAGARLQGYSIPTGSLYNYRIVAIVLFVNKKVYMRFVGTHKEYEKIKDI